ncbi:MAG: hypothetical protein HWN67_07215 [Candidatus Helarchaeota archaeon]|nr:hypothetical protein [Candidatus Helarchaeota archaeon]
MDVVNKSKSDINPIFQKTDLIITASHDACGSENGAGFLERYSSRNQAIIMEIMRNLVEYALVERIYLGGSIGGETIALHYGLCYRKVSKKLRFIVVVPVTVEYQPIETWETIKCADDIICLDLQPYKYGLPDHKIYYVRNKHIFHIAMLNTKYDLKKIGVLAFCNGNFSINPHSVLSIANNFGIDIEKIELIDF